MREISQLIFSRFKTQYIDTKTNIFDQIDNLTLEILAGKTVTYIKNEVKDGKISQEMIDETIATEKTTLKNFIIYQLSNADINFGVGCGFYDEIGDKDEKGISLNMNKYLFDICFNPDINEKNFEHFLDFILSNYSRPRFNEEALALDGKNITAIFIPALLKNYWDKFKDVPLPEKIKEKKRELTTLNQYKITYADYVEDAYEALNKLTSK